MRAHGSPGQTLLEEAFGGDAFVFRRRVAFGVLAAVLALVAVAVVLAWRQYDDARRNALRELRARAVLGATVFDTAITGQLNTLQAIALSPAVTSGDAAAMRAYFHRMRRAQGGVFTGGLGFIDLTGRTRASSVPGLTAATDYSDRSWFKAVLRTRRPYVSEGLVGRVQGNSVVVEAVPVRDARGRLIGMVTGSFRVNPLRETRRNVELGYAGLAVIDRSGRLITEKGFPPPANAKLAARIERGGPGVLDGVRGLDGTDSRVVAYARSAVPGWTIALDQPRSSVLAAARRSLTIELITIAAAAAVALSLIGLALVRSRRRAEADRERALSWGELSRSLGDASRAVEIAEPVAAALSAAFPGATVLVALEGDTGPGLEIVAVHGPSQEAAKASTAAFLAAPVRAYESARPVKIETEAALAARLPDVYERLAAEVRSLVVVPLIVRGGRPIGSLALYFPDERGLDAKERTLVAAHADQTAQALARMRRYEREHEVAVSLQRSLLPERRPVAPGLDIAARYRAGGAGLEVGGDWYDVVTRPDGLVHVTVGDVAGRGIRAAAVMSQLRNAFQAYGFEHTSPAEITRRLLRHVPEDTMATAVNLVIDPYTHELSYSCAGHPPCLLLDHDRGAVTRLDGAGAPPLGFASPASVTEAAVALPARATLVAYTDGLVERRGRSIDDGIELLETLLVERADLDADEVADGVLREVFERLGTDDDIALLVLRFAAVPARVDLIVPADPLALAGLRRRLRTWLGLRGVDEETAYDAVLALSEACANAIEHAYAFGTGTIRVALEDVDGELRIEVDDEGAWREAVPDESRGRGIAIMSGLMDEADVAGGPGGTRVRLARRMARR